VNWIMVTETVFNAVQRILDDAFALRFIAY
jgi:hypothetical protein